MEGTVPDLSGIRFGIALCNSGKSPKNSRRVGYVNTLAWKNVVYFQINEDRLLLLVRRQLAEASNLGIVLHPYQKLASHR